MQITTNDKTKTFFNQFFRFIFAASIDSYFSFLDKLDFYFVFFITFHNLLPDKIHDLQNNRNPF